MDSSKIKMQIILLLHSSNFFVQRHKGIGRKYLRPESRVNYVESLQVLLVPVRQSGVHFPDPGQRGPVVRRRRRVEVGDDVVSVRDGVEQVDQVKQRLVKKRRMKEKRAEIQYKSRQAFSEKV